MGYKINKDKFWLEPILLQAFQKLYKNDSYLIEHGNNLFQQENNKERTGNSELTHVSERGIVFRFGIYLQELAYCDMCLSGYNIDTEYNRKGNEIKTGNNKNIYPDLIIHKRGSQKDNLLIIEFKPHWNNKRKEDKQKLHIFKRKPYNYKNALSVLIDKFEPKLDWI